MEGEVEEVSGGGGAHGRGEDLRDGGGGQECLMEPRVGTGGWIEFDRACF